MKRAACPEGQIDIFPEQLMAELFAHQMPAAPLPPLPFPRNAEVDVARACRILDTNQKTVERMLREKLLRGYKIKAGKKGRPTYRIEHASVVEYCDNLRILHHIAPRKATASSRPPDNSILPFPPSETISVQEVADHLGVAPTTVRKLFDSGSLIAYQLIVDSKSPWRISRPSLVEYLQDLRRDAGPKRPSFTSAS